MPACSSEIFTAASCYRSSSPPNSRSSSASPPLSWPIVSGSPQLSVSPTRTPPTGKFERSTSNLSNASLSHANKATYFDRRVDGSGNVLRISSTESLLRNPRWGERETEREANARSEKIRVWSNEEKSEVRTLVGRSRFPANLFAWYGNLVYRAFARFYEILSYVVWTPIIWISAWICVFWVLMQLPLSLVKWFIRVLYTPSWERSRAKRCVLITGGSTIQALHLARNFYRAGARVVVCEIDGLFGLARFSTACSRFYTLPKPGPGTAAEYVNALKTIIEREKVLYFVPVSCTSGAYYDSLAKSHLEIMGCECFVPGTADVTSLEDPHRLMQRCASLGLPCPSHRLVSSLEDVASLYENGHFATNDRYVMASAGPAGMNEHAVLQLPNSLDNATPRNLRRRLEQHEISERKPWLIMREVGSAVNAYQMVTCTTVKDSRVVANVTCRLDETRGLVPEERKDVDQWLDTFFRAPFTKRINGHLSFKLAFDAENGRGLVPISCRVGVPLPYLCLTSVHPRLVWRPCRHFSRQNSVNLVVNEKYKMAAHPRSNLRSASSDALLFAHERSKPVQEDDRCAPCDDNRRNDHSVLSSSPALDKRDALFVYWDPLPYCAYYHLQFPFRRLAGAIRHRPAQHKPPLALVK